MSRTQRGTLLGLAAAVLVAGLIIAIAGKGDDEDKASSGPQAIVVKNAKPVGGVKDLTWKKGSTIDLAVTSDTADEVHFHGYDVHEDVAKGGTAHFRIPATIEGKFVVELEEHEQTLANVTVTP